MASMPDFDDGDDARRPFRVLTYSHDSFGLGHLRRSVTLATALVSRGRHVHALCLTGSPVPDLFALPKQCDLVKLPSIGKGTGGQYVARRLPMSASEITSLRSDIVTATVRSFRPDLLLVDHTAIGPGGELLPVLRRLRHESLQTRVVLGMRDVLDTPLRARAEIQRDATFEVLRTLYDHVLVYGDRSVFDPVREYGFPDDVAAKTTFTGPVVPPEALLGRERPAREVPHVLVTTGGGEDGYELLRGVVAALRGPLRSDSLRVTIVAGPLLAEDSYADLARAVQGDPRIRLDRCTTAMQSLLDDADVVVGMGGYNTVYECLARGRTLLVLPRRAPREEQWERCRRLAALGHLRLLEHGEVADPHATAASLRDALQQARGAPARSLGCRGAEIAARTCLSQRRRRSGGSEAARTIG
ncbi:MAG: hypothetical protein JNK78_11350 [Planctomycetes bacterium]|nr:hypothetical protein [Planctomycetota bacterium]